MGLSSVSGLLRRFAPRNDGWRASTQIIMRQGEALVANTTDVKVPDIGDFKDVPIIEILVKPGDQVKADDPLVTLESDKATMDVPAPGAGKVAEILAKVGDKVSMGSLLLRLDQATNGAAAAANTAPAAKTEAEK